jgi:hypothetical protein
MNIHTFQHCECWEKNEEQPLVVEKREEVRTRAVGEDVTKGGQERGRDKTNTLS